MSWRSIHLQRFVRTDPQEENTETKSPDWMKSVPWSTVTGRCYLFQGPRSRSQQNHLRIPSWRGLSMPDQTLYQEWMVNTLIHEKCCTCITIRKVLFCRKSFLFELNCERYIFIFSPWLGNICLQSMGINQLMQYGYAELKYIIDWAKKVPGKRMRPTSEI